MKRYFPVVLLLLFLTFPVLAQSDTTNTQSEKEQQKLVTCKSPMGALLRSVAIPGWGQFYNRSYIKSVVVFGLESFFIYKAIHWWKKTEDQYSLIQNSDESWKAYEFSIYESYRGRRNDYLWLVGITVFLSMFDAYVDAHLSGFDVDLTPDFSDEKSSAQLRFTLKFW